ncbi:DUF421 domain-containing protein [Aquihabitans daechungensis]|uniref:DUF421 domain-containing protein n=1 Tax=Aquihabitans daechungensis TaxID=1052257 RepID=UPI003B9EB6D9
MTVIIDSWYGIARVAVVSVLAYGWLLVVLRVTGKRTLAKLNAFDLVVTVALGSTLATVALSPDVALAEGAVAAAVLCGAQYLVAWASARYESVRDAVKATPVFVVRDGILLRDVLRSERLTESEVRQALRQSGQGGIERAAAVVLETDGSLTVVPDGARGSGSALAGVRDPTSIRDGQGAWS